MNAQALQQRLEALERANAALQSNFAALEESTEKMMSDRHRLQKKVEELEAMNKRLVDMLWGRRSERRVPHGNAPMLPGAEDWLQAETPTAAIVAGEEEQAALDLELIRKWEERNRQRREQRQQNKNSPEAFPEHMERRERIIDLPEERKEGLTYIGDDVSEKMRFERATAYIDRVVRRKYVHAQQPELGVISEPAPLSIVEGCKYDFSVIAAIVAMKYAFHQPTYRQQDWFSQCGWFPSRSTINDLLNLAVATLGPLVAQMWQRVLQPSVLLIDETRVLLLTRGALSSVQEEQIRHRKQEDTEDESVIAVVEEGTCRGSVTSFAWLYTSLSDEAPYNVFQWSLTRQHAVLDAALATYRGTIVGDAYDGYVHIHDRSEGRIEHASCNTHARRKFVSAETYEPILCAQIISLYRQLFEIENRLVTSTVEERHEVRQRDAIPIWKSMETWLHSERVVRAALPSSPFGKAVGYLQNQWHALQRYLSDGAIPISNDHAEQVIRPLTVGRRNWLFIGHPNAAVGRMQLLSVVSSAHRHNLIVEDYLADVLRQLADAQQSHPQDLELGSRYLLELLPDRWAISHAKSVRKERAQEKKDVSDAKRVRRAKRRQRQRALKQAQKKSPPKPDG